MWRVDPETRDRIRVILRSGRMRWAVIAAGSIGVLGIARWLEPDPSGHGTHTQLGLLPCSFLWLTGVPCPLCGATTTFALMADGRVRDAFLNQPFAALLYCGTVATVVVAGQELLGGAAWSERLFEVVRRRELEASIVFLFLMALGWTYSILKALFFSMA